MKKILLLTLAFFIVCGSAFAQTKIVHLDLNRIVYESKAGKKAAQDLAKLEADYAKALEPLVNEIMKMEQEYMEQERLLTDAAKKSRYDAYLLKTQEYEEQARVYGDKLQAKSNELMGVIMNEVEKVINQIVADNKYDLVLYSQAVVVAPNAKDITEDVIKKYDATK